MSSDDPGGRAPQLEGSSDVTGIRRVRRSQRRRSTVVTAFALAAIVAAGGAYGFFHVNRPAGLDGAIRQIGFFPINPPSVLTAVGSIFHVTDNGRQYITVCRADPSMIAGRIRFSPTEKVISQELTAASFDVTTALASKLKSAGMTNVVESVTYSLTSVEVGEISSAELNGVFTELQKDLNCRQEVERLLRLGEFVCQGQRILRASAEVRVKYANALDATVDVRAEAIEKVRNSVADRIGGAGSVTNNLIRSGSGLHYGIRVREFCLALPDERPARLPRTALGWYARRAERFASSFF